MFFLMFNTYFITHYEDGSILMASLSKQFDVIFNYRIKKETMKIQSKINKDRAT